MSEPQRAADVLNGAQWAAQARNFQENFGLIFDRQHHVELEVRSPQHATVSCMGLCRVGLRGCVRHQERRTFARVGLFRVADTEPEGVALLRR